MPLHLGFFLVGFSSWTILNRMFFKWLFDLFTVYRRIKLQIRCETKSKTVEKHLNTAFFFLSFTTRIESWARAQLDCALELYATSKYHVWMGFSTKMPFSRYKPFEWLIFKCGTAFSFLKRWNFFPRFYWSEYFMKLVFLNHMIKNAFEPLHHFTWNIIDSNQKWYLEIENVPHYLMIVKSHISS